MTRNSHPTKVRVSRINNQDKPIETRKFRARLSQKEGDLNSSSNQLLTTTITFLKHEDACFDRNGAQNNNSKTIEELNTIPVQALPRLVMFVLLRFQVMEHKGSIQTKSCQAIIKYWFC